MLSVNLKYFRLKHQNCFYFILSFIMQLSQARLWQIKVYTEEHFVLFIIVGNKISNQNSNPEQYCLHFTLLMLLGKAGIYLFSPPLQLYWIGVFSFSKATSLRGLTLNSNQFSPLKKLTFFQSLLVAEGLDKYTRTVMNEGLRIQQEYIKRQKSKLSVRYLTFMRKKKLFR